MPLHNDHTLIDRMNAEAERRRAEGSRQPIKARKPRKPKPRLKSYTVILMHNGNKRGFHIHAISSRPAVAEAVRRAGPGGWTVISVSKPGIVLR